MEDGKGGCLAVVILVVVLIATCTIFLRFKPEPLFTVKMIRPVPTATPNVFHQILLEQSRTDNQLKLEVTRHELRKQWAWIAAPWAVIILGSVCFVMAFRKWLRGG